MSKQFYPYLWQIQSNTNISYQEYIPYLEISSENLMQNSKKIYVNDKFNYSNIPELNEFFLKIYADIRFKLMLNRQILAINNDYEYIVEKWIKKSTKNKNPIYFMSCCLKEIFTNLIIYLKDDKIYIFLDYKKNDEIYDKAKRIVEIFLPINMQYCILFEHFLVLDSNNLKHLERWVLL